MIEVKNLRVVFGQTPALHDVSLTVQTGEVVAIVGTNGAGKSTLLLSLVGIVKPVHGEILFEGKTLLNMAPEDIVRMGIALVPERRHIFQGMTVEENLRLGGCSFCKDKHEVKEMMEYVLDVFPALRRFLPKRAGGLSGGEQQMLTVARALMAKPRALLLDEPSLGLSPLVIQGLFQAFSRLREGGLTILLVEQSVDRVLTFADRAYVLRSGRVELEGASGSLSKAELQAAYFGLAGKGVEL